MMVGLQKASRICYIDII